MLTIRPSLASLLLVFSVLTLSALPSQDAYAASQETAEQRAARWAKERQELDAKFAAEKAQRLLEQEQVVKALPNYQFPVRESQCADFTVDWKQVTTVQAYVQFSVQHARSLGNCLQAEAAHNAKHFAAYLKAENIGEISWSGGVVPDSIEHIQPFSDLAANHDRCDARCYELIQQQLKKILAVAVRKRNAFVGEWDNHVDNNIKPAMKAQDPEGYKQNNVDTEFKNIRSAVEFFPLQKNKPAQ